MVAKQSALRFDADENPYVSHNIDGSGRSRLLDIVWDFSPLEQRVHKISFEAIEVIHRQAIQSVIAQAIEYTKSKSDSGHFSVQTARTYKVSLHRIACSWGKSDFSLLDHEQEWEDLKSSLEGKFSLSVTHLIRNMISVLNKIGIISRYVTVKEFELLARKNSFPKQAVALPQIMHAQMLSTAVRSVEKYHIHSYDISNCMTEFCAIRKQEYLQVAKEISEGFSICNLRQKINLRVLSKAKNIRRPTALKSMRIDNNAAFVSKIVQDCFLVVIAFSGARKSELALMNPDSYREKNGISYIQGQQSKSNEGIPTSVVWQTHPIVKKALELAYNATQYIRVVQTKKLQVQLAQKKIDLDSYNRFIRELGSSFIQAATYKMEDLDYVKDSFLITNKGGNFFDVKDFLKPATESDVEEFNILNPTRIGELEVGGYPTKFSPHDLRRSFAVFIVRNKLGNIFTIKEQFFHQNLNMSNYYANNAELARVQGLLLDDDLLDIIDRYSTDEAVEALDDIYNGSGLLSGAEGERIMKVKKEALRKGEKIYISKSQLRSLVENGEKSIVMLPTGSYCTNPTCERLCAISCFNAEDKPCEHEVVTTRGAKIRSIERDRLILVFREMNKMNDYSLYRILVGVKEKIIFIESTLRKHDLVFEPFSDEIRSVSI